MNKMEYAGNKGFRLLHMYERLNKGEVLHKETLAIDFGVTCKTIQRDIDDLRAYLAETHMFEKDVAIQYNRKLGGYCLVKLDRDWLTSAEVLSLCKILLESRGLCEAELRPLVEKLLSQVTPNEREHVANTIRSELRHYIPLRHNKPLMDSIWNLSSHISARTVVKIEYKRQDGVVRQHAVKPVAIMFSEFYFYLIAYLADDSKSFPTVFRIDRIMHIKATKDHFKMPYEKQFSEGEFRKRVQFMYAGELRTVRFRYSGPSVEAVLDRLPTAEILAEDNGVFDIQAEVYGNGVDIWLKGQDDWVCS